MAVDMTPGLDELQFQGAGAIAVLTQAANPTLIWVIKVPQWVGTWQRCH